MFTLLLALLTPADAGSAATAEYARQVSTAQVRMAQLEALLSESELRIGQLEEVIRQRMDDPGQRTSERLAFGLRSRQAAESCFRFRDVEKAGRPERLIGL